MNSGRDKGKPSEGGTGGRDIFTNPAAFKNMRADSKGSELGEL